MQIALFSDDKALDYPVRDIILDHGHHCSIQISLPVEDLTAFDAAGLEGIDGIVLLASDDLERAADWVRVVCAQIAVPVLVIGRGDDSRGILEIIRVGAHDYLPHGVTLSADVRAALQRLEDRRRSAQPEAKVICVASAAGGAGTSTIAANLAVLLAEACGRCGLIDLDLRRGDLARHFDVQPGRTLADLVAATSRLDTSLMEQALCMLPSGVALLAAPPALSDLPRVTYDAVNRIIETARRMFPVIVIDLEDVFHLEQFSVINRCDRLLLVTRPDVSSFCRTRKALEFISQSSRIGDRCRMLVNHSDAVAALNVAQGSRLLGVKEWSVVPHDPLHVNVSVNLGNPVVSEHPDAPSARALRKIAAQLAREFLGAEAGAALLRETGGRAPRFLGKAAAWLCGLTRLSF